MKDSKVPVLFIVFSRFETTKRVFEKIRNYKPSNLYLASDGPRNKRIGEIEKVKEIRNYLIDNVDWPCTVKTRFNEENQGCKYGPHNAITWFFENEESGIVLEDDCLPSDSFFPYCAELLDNYRQDLRVFGIAGPNFYSHIELDSSYYFSDFFFTWGWATWKDRWEKHLEVLDSFETYIQDSNVNAIIDNKAVRNKLIKKAIISYNDQLDAWDYPWFFTCMVNNGLIINPAKNLIQNIGFGEGATHTAGYSQNQRKNEVLEFPLKHPLIFKSNKKMDNLVYEGILHWMSPIRKLTSLNYIIFAITKIAELFLKKIGVIKKNKKN